MAVSLVHEVQKWEARTGLRVDRVEQRKDGVLHVVFVNYDVDRLPQYKMLAEQLDARIGSTGLSSKLVYHKEMGKSTGGGKFVRRPKKDRDDYWF